ncbi:MAG: class I SAM-dependent methyltransferase [Pseudomonadales bacterium]
MKSNSHTKHSGLSNLSKKSDDVAEYYDNWAGDYDGTLSDWRYEAPEQVASMLGAELSLESSVLDAGCGTGLSGKALLTAGFTTIDGIDVSRRSLEIASKTKAYKTLREIDLQRLPLPIQDDLYDGLACVGVLTYLTDSISTLREFSRIVKPGGFVAITQRSDLFAEREFPSVLEGLSKEGIIAQVRISEPRPYLPDNEEFGDQILVHYIGFTVV